MVLRDGVYKVERAWFPSDYYYPASGKEYYKTLDHFNSSVSGQFCNRHVILKDQNFSKINTKQHKFHFQPIFDLRIKERPRRNEV